MDSSLEEISESLHGFCRKFVTADARSLIKTKFYLSAKTNKLQQTGGGGGGRKTPKSTWFFKY